MLAYVPLFQSKIFTLVVTRNNSVFTAQLLFTFELAIIIEYKLETDGPIIIMSNGREREVLNERK